MRRARRPRRTPPSSPTPSGSALAALANVVIPPGATPGGADLGAVAYVERLCTAFEGTHHAVHLRRRSVLGAASVPDHERRAGHHVAEQRLRDVPAARSRDRARLAHRAVRLGKCRRRHVQRPRDRTAGDRHSRADEERARRRHRGVSRCRSRISPPAGAARRVRRPRRRLPRPTIQLVTEAAFSAPEYGGNIGLGGWKLARYEGDSFLSATACTARCLCPAAPRPVIARTPRRRCPPRIPAPIPRR